MMRSGPRDGESSAPVSIDPRFLDSPIPSPTKGKRVPGQSASAPRCGSVPMGESLTRHRRTPDPIGSRERAEGDHSSVPQGTSLPGDVVSSSEIPRRVMLAEDNRDLLEIFARQLTMLGLEV